MIGSGIHSQYYVCPQGPASNDSFRMLGNYYGATPPVHRHHLSTSLLTLVPQDALSGPGARCLTIVLSVLFWTV